MIINDRVAENTETFIVHLSFPDPLVQRVTLDPKDVTVEIHDDDGK